MFQHVPIPGGPWSVWSPQDLPGGASWDFQGTCIIPGHSHDISQLFETFTIVCILLTQLIKRHCGQLITAHANFKTQLHRKADDPEPQLTQHINRRAFGLILLVAKHYLKRSSHCRKATSGEGSLQSMSTTPTQALQASGAHWEAVANLMSACLAQLGSTLQVAWQALGAARGWMDQQHCKSCPALPLRQLSQAQQPLAIWGPVKSAPRWLVHVPNASRRVKSSWISNRVLRGQDGPPPDAESVQTIFCDSNHTRGPPGQSQAGCQDGCPPYSKSDGPVANVSLSYLPWYMKLLKPSANKGALAQDPLPRRCPSDCLAIVCHPILQQLMP